MRHIAAHYLIDRSCVIKRPIISLDDDGRIVSVKQWERLDTMPQTEFYSGALSAGFVNAHCHVELSYLRGAIERGTGFAGFARAIGQVRGGYTAQERERALYAADATMWAEGVQAVGDVVNGVSTYDMKCHSPIRYHSFAELFGLRSQIDAIEPLLMQADTTPTPHSIYSLQDEPFRSVSRLAGSAPLSIHFMESPDEKALYAGEGSLASWYERMGWQCDFLHYGSPAARLVGSLPRESRLMLVHGCCVEEEDIAMLEEYFINPIAWVLCPQSNDYISGLKPPVKLLRRHKALICIGTDSLASNSNLSMLEEVKRIEGVPFAERMEWATLGGARALGMDDELGSVEVGKRPGLVLIEGYTTQGLDPAATARRIV